MDFALTMMDFVYDGALGDLPRGVLVDLRLVLYLLGALGEHERRQRLLAVQTGGAGDDARQPG